MFSTGVANESTILKLRVKGSDLDPLALRGRLQNLLGEISFQPRLPPSATLFIRKLNDPMPGLLQLDTTHPRAPEAWRHAFNTRFDQLVSSAARPARGWVGDSAESVVFYDYSELLASLAADWCSGYATTRWWWRGLLQRGDVAQVIKRFWSERVEYVPAALELLVKRDVLVEFVSRLSEDEVRVLLERVVHVFALHAIRDVIQTRITRIEKPNLVFEIRAPGDTPVRTVMPWRDTVPECDTPRLQPVQRLFVAVALMIRRAPSRVRTLCFAKEVEQWSERVIGLSNASEPIVTVIENVVGDAPAETSAAIIDDEIIVESSTIAVDSTVAPAPVKPACEQIKIGNAVFSYEEHVEVSQARPEEPPIVSNEESIVQRDLQIEPAPQTPTTPVRESLDAITFETELGGLFYLINLAIFLDIDITTDLGIWEFVAIVGAEILDEQNFDDPIWTGLQDLQDLQDINPVNHENPVNHLNKAAWLHELMPSLYARLYLALGDVDLAGLLLNHHAKVIITETHLDVFFALAEHPIELRLSGLDRNPGWVPAAGRFIAFHYD